MMLGTRKSFEYIKCSHCGLLWIAQIPDNLGDYYPQQYFSFQSRLRHSRSAVRKYFDRLRVRSELDGNGWFARFSNRLVKRLDYLDWIKAARLDQQAAILDVGCGSGKLLQKMRLGGFLHTEGIDPFLEDDIHYPDGLIIHKQQLKDFATTHVGKYDLIMLHHAYEHMPHPRETLQLLSSMLSEQGHLLIRIPLVDSLAWEMFHENWAQLDAPRHLYLHSKHSMRLLAESCKLSIVDIKYDSTVYQFVSSHLYQLDISGDASKQEKDQAIASMPTEHYRQLTEQVNQSQQGDMAGFLLKKQ